MKKFAISLLALCALGSTAMANIFSSPIPINSYQSITVHNSTDKSLDCTAMSKLFLGNWTFNGTPLPAGSKFTIQPTSTNVFKGSLPIGNLLGITVVCHKPGDYYADMLDVVGTYDPTIAPVAAPNCLGQNGVICKLDSMNNNTASFTVS